MALNSYHQRLPFGGSHRSVVVCHPVQIDLRGPFVLFCADGQSTEAFARSFLGSYPGKSIFFVGVYSSERHRNAEYVWGRDESCFLQHERFFTESVCEWFAETFQFRLVPSRTGLFGFSCGGAFAVSMGIRHAERFGHVFAYSVAGRPIANFEGQLTSDLSGSSFYLAAGTREPKGMRSYMQRLKKWLNANDATATMTVSQGDHEFSFWSNALNIDLGQCLNAIEND